MFTSRSLNDLKTIPIVVMSGCTLSKMRNRFFHKPFRCIQFIQLILFRRQEASLLFLNYSTGKLMERFLTRKANYCFYLVDSRTNQLVYKTTNCLTAIPFCQQNYITCQAIIRFPAFTDTMKLFILYSYMFFMPVDNIISYYILRIAE